MQRSWQIRLRYMILQIRFLLPRYFLLVVELDQFDPALEYELEQFNL